MYSIKWRSFRTADEFRHTTQFSTAIVNIQPQLKNCRTDQYINTRYRLCNTLYTIHTTGTINFISNLSAQLSSFYSKYSRSAARVAKVEICKQYSRQFNEETVCNALIWFISTWNTNTLYTVHYTPYTIHRTQHIAHII